MGDVCKEEEEEFLLTHSSLINSQCSAEFHKPNLIIDFNLSKNYVFNRAVLINFYPFSIWYLFGGWILKIYCKIIIEIKMN